MLALIRRMASPLTLVLALVAAGIILALMLRPIAEFKNTLGKPSLPDTTLPPVNLYEAAGFWPPDTISLYLTRIAPLDIFYPVALGFSLAFALAPLTGPTSRWPMIGICAILADWAENASFATILNTLEAPILGLGPFAMALTLLKFALYLFGLGAVAFLFWTRRRQP